MTDTEIDDGRAHGGGTPVAPPTPASPDAPSIDDTAVERSMYQDVDTYPLGAEHRDAYTDAAAQAMYDVLEAAGDIAEIEPSDYYDRMAVSSDLPEDIPAATLAVYGLDEQGLSVETVFVANDSLFDRPRHEQENIALHELYEAVQPRDDLGRFIQEQYDVPPEDARDVSRYLDSSPNWLREGVTQYLANERHPSGARAGRDFYPEETRIAGAMLEEEGVDIAGTMGRSPGEPYEDAIKGWEESGDISLVAPDAAPADAQVVREILDGAQ